MDAGITGAPTGREGCRVTAFRVSDAGGAVGQSNPVGQPFAHLLELDGLRGVAVAAVVAFHAHWLRGGWLGVDVFFVLSGFLITRLLLAEFERDGSVALASFWGRRARRLLPALTVVLLVVSWQGPLRESGVGASTLRSDVVAAIFYVSNWVRLHANVGYWSQFGQPGPLDHLWSLAIEEQFYLVWPLGLVAFLRRRGALSLRRILPVALLAAGLWQVAVFARTGDISRTYMGTDTRVVGLLAGAGLATFENDLRRMAPIVLRTLGYVGLIVMGVAGVLLNGRAAITYRGALLACTIASAFILSAVITGAFASASVVARAFRRPALRWLGLRSYGLYLWHWPILVWFGAENSIPASPIRRVLAIAISCLVAEISFRFVEMPLRGPAWRSARRTHVLVVAAFAIPALSLGIVQFRSSRTSVAAGYRAAPPVVVAVSNATVASVSPVATVASQPASTTPIQANLQPADTAYTTSAAAPTSLVSPSELTGRLTAALPISLPAGKKPRILLVGDSIAVALGRTLSAEADRLGIVIEVRARSACQLVDTTTHIRLNDDGGNGEPLSQECADVVRSYAEVSARFKPDAVIVAFGGVAYWQSQFGPDSWGDPCAASYGAWAAGHLRSAANALAGAAHTPVFVITKPYWGTPLVVPAPELNRMTDCENEAIGDTSARSEGTITPLDLHALVCPHGPTCLTKIDGVELRPDGAHFEGASAVLVGRWMFAQMFKGGTVGS